MAVFIVPLDNHRNRNRLPRSCFDMYNVLRYNWRSLRWRETGVILSFRNQASEDIFNRKSTKGARKLCPAAIWPVAQRKMDQLNASVSLASLAIPPGNRLEALSGDRHGQHSVRINEQYRLCFQWTEEGAEQVEITDYH